MSAITEKNTMKLTPVMEKVHSSLGKMSTRWGVNRTVAQTHALLFLVSNPLNAEEITATLGVARSNLSRSQKAHKGCIDVYGNTGYLVQPD